MIAIALLFVRMLCDCFKPRIICSCSTSSTFDESFRNTLPISMRRGRTFRSGRTRPADGQSNNSETLSRIQSLADYTIDTLESSFRKRQEEVLQVVVVVVVVHARECNNNREYKQNAETMRQSFSQKFPQLERLLAQANAYRVMVGDAKFCRDAAVIFNELAQEPR